MGWTEMKVSFNFLFEDILKTICIFKYINVVGVSCGFKNFVKLDLDKKFKIIF